MTIVVLTKRIKGLPKNWISEISLRRNRLNSKLKLLLKEFTRQRKLFIKRYENPMSSILFDLNSSLTKCVTDIKEKVTKLKGKFNNYLKFRVF